MKEALEKGAYEVIETLHKNGFEGYLVGGCVRDQLLNRPVKDYDIATSARPEQVERMFARTIPTGIQHGTVTVVIQGQPYEVTTFRKEDAYENYRRPAEVEYIDSLYEDLRRRDFTMNAMALDRERKLIDPFDGESDMKRGILRCVGNADERLQEDALRMLRCIRFASEYALEVEAATWDALCRLAPLLQHIAMERVRMELERMLSGSSPNRAIDLLAASGILRYSKIPLLLASLGSLKEPADLSKLKGPLRRWAYVYLRLGASADQTEEELRSLTFSKQQIDEVRHIVGAAVYVGEGLSQHPSEPIEKVAAMVWKLAAIRHGKPAMEALHDILSMNLQVLLALGGSDESAAYCMRSGMQWLEEMPVDKVASLQLSGGELIAAIGQPAGPWVAQTLQHLVKQAALGQVANDKSALLDEAAQYAANNKESDNRGHT
ncbi:CCA tRNA nucleotidyltransferase [Paenibacillus sp. H1-7]|uniref:CCA tRNA nucleotidyltransferase n=1 Tax=Paenibacillus sp. H1-7 TaxID=2282849 RepID=UPI001EF7AB5B|nr:CCA tRNA nucleotidyltransferase [Paenibacillus sp. H1-7]ULL15597.1 CCA tRNA nucleotidyltransferase [Paenibacillus sp. H1-7]